MKGYLNHKISQLKSFASNKIKYFTNLNFRLILLKKPIISNAKSDIEVFTLVGHDYLWIYLLSIFSFKYCFNLDVQITIYDDGSLIDKDVNILRKKIRNIRIVRKNEIENRIKKLLDKYPAIKERRKESFLMRKLIDCVYLSNKKNLIQLDSDVIFLRKADERFKDLLKNFRISSFRDIKDAPYFSFNNQTIISKNFRKVYKNYFKKEINFVKGFNYGLTRFNKKDIDFDKIEKFLIFLKKKQKTKLSRIENRTSEQTCLAYLISINKMNIKFFPFKLFTVYHPGYNRTIKDAISLHFVNQWRFINFAYLKYFYKYLYRSLINKES